MKGEGPYGPVPVLGIFDRLDGYAHVDCLSKPSVRATDHFHSLGCRPLRFSRVMRVSNLETDL